MSEKELAQHIIRLVGGKENIASVQHCATRLRIVVHDKDKINVKEVENLNKVKGVFLQCRTVPDYPRYRSCQSRIR